MREGEEEGWLHLCQLDTRVDPEVEVMVAHGGTSYAAILNEHQGLVSKTPHQAHTERFT